VRKKQSWVRRVKKDHHSRRHKKKARRYLGYQKRTDRLDRVSACGNQVLGCAEWS
jgi:hypothetical protein